MLTDIAIDLRYRLVLIFIFNPIFVGNEIKLVIKTTHV